jgi:deoxycytidylate deaminase
MNPFEAMQQAVDIVNDSEHPTNKIAACLFHNDQWIAEHNQRPQALKNHFEWDYKLGSSSQFIHAEIACLFHAPFTIAGSSLCVTDPMCPNCAKGIAEMGVSHVYIDHKGMDKDFIKRRGNDFETMSLLMMERAGIGVSILHRKDQKIETLIAQSEVNIEYQNERADYASTDINGETIIAHDGFPPNINHQDADICESNKYRFHLDPLNKLLFKLARQGLKTAHVICSNHPSSRALVNAVGFGITNITVLSSNLDHGDHGHQTAQILEENGILTINRVY